MSLADLLPSGPGRFIGRVQDPELQAPVPVVVMSTSVWDARRSAPTVADLLERDDLDSVLDELTAQPPRWHTEEIALEEDGANHLPQLLAPVDLQVIKACGVTFAGSMLERVIEERSGGDPTAAEAVREQLAAEIPIDIAQVRPGSPESARIKQVLHERGWWSQYLEVGLGPDPEVFTKGPVLSAVTSGADIGVPSFSRWSNPEPELVLIVNSAGQLAGVTLGNDVNLRDVEGRSALLLGMAKDNNRSTVIGPLIRLFDGSYSVEDARRAEIALMVEGEDSFVLEGVNSVSALSRSFEELIAAAFGPHHQYPDGFALFTGTLFAPTQDRGEAGQGFTHRMGDRVTISNDHLGTLVNTVRRTEDLPPWRYGLRHLWRDIARTEASP